MSNNPLLDDLGRDNTSPIISVALPSLGRWYDSEIIDENADPSDLDIRPLGIMSEQHYRDPWLMVAGQAIPRLVRSVCPSIKDPSRLSSLDIDAILVACRIASYGANMTVEHECTNMIANPAAKGENKSESDDEEEEPDLIRCETENTIEIDLYDFIQRYSPMSNFDEYDYLIEPANQIVHLRPTPYEDTMKALKKAMMVQKIYSNLLSDEDISQVIENDEKTDVYLKLIDDTTETTIDTLLASIHSVETSKKAVIGDRDVIREWLMEISPEMYNGIRERISYLRNTIADIPKISYKCRTCGGGNDFRLQMDPQRLFTQAGVSNPEKKPSPKSVSTEKKPKRPSATSQRSHTHTRVRSNTKTSKNTHHGK